MTARTRNRILLAVAAAIPLTALTSVSSAQTRVNQDGRAMDANMRVGGDGSNDRGNGVDRRGQTFSGNQIVTGNVSGNRAFRGPIGYSDPQEFSGPTAGNSSRDFVRDSSGAPTRVRPSTDYGNSTGYYGDSRNTPPPSGYRPQGFTGGFFDSGLGQQTIAGRNPYDRSTAQIFDASSNVLRPSGQLFNGVDQNNQPQSLLATPLTGVMQLNPDLLAPNNNQTSGLSRLDANDRNRTGDRSRMTPADIERMQQELKDADADAAADPNNLAQPLGAKPLSGAIDGGQAEGTQSPRAGAAGARNGGTDAGPADANSTGQLQPAVTGGKVGTASGQPALGLERRLNVPPAKQSKQFAELQLRLQQAEAGQPVSDEVAQRDLRMLNKAQADANAVPTGQPGAPAEGGAPKPMLAPLQGGGPAKPATATPKATPAAKPAVEAAPKAPPAAAANRPAPLKIKSLAEGVTAKGLRDLLVNAEKSMQTGNFKSAIETYSTAEQVAPNNPMIRLGRAQAEMGAAFYGSAEQHLRDAVAGDPALLMGQYDLESFIGRDRLSFIVKDLKQTASDEPGAARPLILLAYIAYGMPGQESAAGEYLNAAAKRVGRPDPLIDAMRKTWTLPAAEVPADLNK